MCPLEVHSFIIIMIGTGNIKDLASYLNYDLWVE